MAANEQDWECRSGKEGNRREERRQAVGSRQRKNERPRGKARGEACRINAEDKAAPVWRRDDIDPEFAQNEKNCQRRAEDAAQKKPDPIILVKGEGGQARDAGQERDEEKRAQADHMRETRHMGRDEERRQSAGGRIDADGARGITHLREPNGKQRHRQRKADADERDRGDRRR